MGGHRAASLCLSVSISVPLSFLSTSLCALCLCLCILVPLSVVAGPRVFLDSCFPYPTVMVIPQSPGSPWQAHGPGATPTLLPGPWPWQYGASSLQGHMVIGRGLFGALELLPGKLLLVCGGRLPAPYLSPDFQEPSRWGRLGARFCIWRAGQLCGLLLTPWWPGRVCTVYLLLLVD